MTMLDFMPEIELLVDCVATQSIVSDAPRDKGSYSAPKRGGGGVVGVDLGMITNANPWEMLL